GPRATRQIVSINHHDDPQIPRTIANAHPVTATPPRRSHPLRGRGPRATRQPTTPGHHDDPQIPRTLANALIQSPRRHHGGLTP
ncbi:MAG: hypothetical protein ACRDHW_08380, partial [Ktedonobacteraceae bacterium]